MINGHKQNGKSLTIKMIDDFKWVQIHEIIIKGAYTHFVFFEASAINVILDDIRWTKNRKRLTDCSTNRLMEDL